MIYAGSSVFTIQQLITWIDEHGVFDILWEAKKTHVQLVQRSNEIFKVLPKEKLLTQELLERFWSLTRSDYKTEVLKIINEAAFHLDADHIEYLFNQITETPANKLGMEEFETISKLGQFSKSVEFSEKSSDFFWRIMTDSESYSNELIENVINKFSGMIKYKPMEKK